MPRVGIELRVPQEDEQAGEHSSNKLLHPGQVADVRLRAEGRLVEAQWREGGEEAADVGVALGDEDRRLVAVRLGVRGP